VKEVIERLLFFCHGISSAWCPLRKGNAALRRGFRCTHGGVFADLSIDESDASSN